MPRPRVGERLREHRHLLRPPDQRHGRAGPRCATRRARRRRPPATGCALPLTVNGASSVVRKAVCERATTSTVASSWPGRALDITRAARLIASPLTE